MESRAIEERIFRVPFYHVQNSTKKPNQVFDEMIFEFVICTYLVFAMRFVFT